MTPPSPSTSSSPPPSCQPLAFAPLTGLYEPSAIQQLADGRFLVVEDEKDFPFSLIELSDACQVSRIPLNPEPLEGDEAFGKLNDLEALTLDHAGRIYAITSHSRDGGGAEKRSRDKLVRFRIVADRVATPELATGLKAALIAAHPLLAAAAAIEDVKGAGGLNIEALEITPDELRLLVGFRSPLRDGLALIAAIEDPDALFGGQTPAHITTHLISLDLGGHGLRGMAYFPSLGGYLLISGPVTREAAQFQLWFWGGEPGSATRRMTIPGLSGLQRAEGICPAHRDGHEYIVLVSDDGDRKSGRFASHIILDPSALQPA